MKVGDTDDLFLAVLVDLVAYCAELIVEDPTNQDSVAESCE